MSQIRPDNCPFVQERIGRRAIQRSGLKLGIRKACLDVLIRTPDKAATIRLLTGHFVEPVWPTTGTGSGSPAFR